MSIMDELKKLARPYDEDGALVDDDLDMDLDEPVYTRPTAAAPVQTAAPEAPVNMGTPAAAPTPASSTMGGLGSVGPMGSMGSAGSASEPVRTTASPITMTMSPDMSKYRVVLVQPEKFDCATVIAKHICQGDAVILNCEETNEMVARRIVDFLSGCAFALDGSIRKAANKVFIITPKDVGVNDAKTAEDMTD